MAGMLYHNLARYKVHLKRKFEQQILEIDLMYAQKMRFLGSDDISVGQIQVKKEDRDFVNVYL